MGNDLHTQGVVQGEEEMRVATDAKERKGLPIFSGCVKYFPDALVAVAELSRIGNDQHNPGKPLFWDRSKSSDELDALMRHLIDAGTMDTDNVRHSTKVAWRALANLQKEIENDTSTDNPSVTPSGGAGEPESNRCVGHAGGCSYPDSAAVCGGQQ